MPDPYPSLAGTIAAYDGGEVFVYSNAALGEDPGTCEYVVLPGHHTVLEIVDRLKRTSAIELLENETVSVSVLLLGAPHPD